jgi:transketolase
VSAYFLVERAFYKPWLARLGDAQIRGDEAGAISALRELCLYNRINALTSVYAALHGWLGASLSVAELLTCLYGTGEDTAPNREDRLRILLGKGHAAAMQYAVLAGLGRFPVADLLRYKQPDGPQAHTDVSTPGIEVNSGSLGQTLSKACGLALGGPGRVVALLGDGELQEGQNFEAFMTLHQLDLRNLLVIVDRNGIQSDSNVADIMDISDLAGVLGGFGLAVRTVEGNDPAAVYRCLSKLRNPQEPTVLIADTAKGAGISFMSARRTPRRGYTWHGGVPTAQEYARALRELASDISDPQVSAQIADFVEGLPTAGKPSAKVATGRLSTGDAFGQAVTELAADPRVLVFDADLEKPCRLTQVARRYPQRFVEMGISEQDMVSCAGGAALRGRLPVVNTYASFYRRAFEQVYVNATEHTRLIYAGHYAGLCYTTDGRTHQCTGDVAMMRSIPHMQVLYPALPEQVGQMLRWYQADGQEQPLYLRLHRTPQSAELRCDEDSDFRFGVPVVVRKRGASEAILTSGPHMSLYCSQATDALAAAGRVAPDVLSVHTLSSMSPQCATELADRYRVLWIVEELCPQGGLFDLVANAMAELAQACPDTRLPRLAHRAADGFTCSTLQPDGLYRHFGLTAEAIAEWVSSPTCSERTET